MRKPSKVNFEGLKLSHRERRSLSRQFKSANKSQSGKRVNYEEFCRKKLKIRKKKAKPSQAKKSKDAGAKIRKCIAKTDREIKDYQHQALESRKSQLLAENVLEDKNIRRMEKLLGIKKKSQKAKYQKGFYNDGLDFLLEICEEIDTAEGVGDAWISKDESATEDGSNVVEEENSENDDFAVEESDENENVDREESADDDDGLTASEELLPSGLRSILNKKRQFGEIRKDKREMEKSTDFDNEQLNLEKKPQKKVRFSLATDDVRNDSAENCTALVEPHPSIENKQISETIRKKLKSIFNKLSESNLQWACSELQQLFLFNSRHEIIEAIWKEISIFILNEYQTMPIKLIRESCALLTLLHCEIDEQIGAYLVHKLCRLLTDEKYADENENKTLDNALALLCQLYNFKVTDSLLLFDILNHFGKAPLTEKKAEMCTNILRDCGPALRKDNPNALTNFLNDLKISCDSVNEITDQDSRFSFFLNTLANVKVNEINKIPLSDKDGTEHFKKVLRGISVKTLNYHTLSASLEEFKSDTGRWAVEVSVSHQKKDHISNSKAGSYSENLITIARKLHMNTEVRRHIFSVIVTAEDYTDAFTKLTKLNLSKVQQREIISVCLHLCLKERLFNPYYAYLMQKFCEFDRRFMVTAKFHFWDKFKEIKNLKKTQLHNLTSLLVHLLATGAVSFSVMKVIPFAQLDHVTMKFVKNVMEQLFCQQTEEWLFSVFSKIFGNQKLKEFSKAIKLFLAHFVLYAGKEGDFERKADKIYQIKIK